MNSTDNLAAKGDCSPPTEVEGSDVADTAAESAPVAFSSQVDALDESAPGEPPEQRPTGQDSEALKPEETVPTQAIPATSTALGGDASRRTLKLVLTLKPGDGPGAIQVIMAIGAEGCDPLLRSDEVEDLQAALDLVPGLLVEAEARWQSQPRYPHVPPRAGGRSASGRAKEVSQSPRDEQIATSGSQQPAQQPMIPKPSSSQLSLFD